MATAPIALFAYNRHWHVRQTVEALAKNELAGASELFVFSDGPGTESDTEKVRSVREYLRTIDGFRSVVIVERERNLGLAQSIIAGVTEVAGRHGRVIVLEDDLVTSPHFLKYMNDALEYYAEEERVISIHGYIYPVEGRLPETFFLRGADCWGWATWKRGWDLFEPDGRKLLEELRIPGKRRKFNFDGTYGYTGMLEDQVAGRNQSWAVRWYASAFLKDKLTLYPGRTLVLHVGDDGSGTHCDQGDKGERLHSEIPTDEPVNISAIPVEEDRTAREEFKKYFRSIRPTLLEMAAGTIKRMRAR